MKWLADGFCKVGGCDEKHWGLGYCAMHYARFKRHGDPLKVRLHPSQIPVHSTSLKRPDLTPAQQINICAIFSGIRA